MKPRTLSFLLLALAGVLIGCGSEQAPGYDAASREAAEVLVRNNNDITKLTPAQRAALERAAKQFPGQGGMLSTNGGGGSTPPATR
jgi:hypothetical protein